MVISHWNLSRVSVALLVASLSGAICGCQETPEDETETPTAYQKDRQRVYSAARDVLRERYTIVGESEQHAQLYATDGVELLGNTRSRKQVTVYFGETFGSRAEPRVNVQQYVEASGNTPFSGDPESMRLSENRTFWLDGWEPLERLPVEEEDLYRAIMARAKGAEI